MAETRLIPKSLWLWTASVSMAVVTLSLWVVPTQAQSGNGVVVNLGVLNDLDPMATVPRLLMPSAQLSRGPIVLRPPPGVDPITPQRRRVVLRSPPGAPARVTSAPTIAVPPPAAAAAAPPTSVTSAPASAPEPPPPAPSPVVAVTESLIEVPAPAMSSPAGPTIDTGSVADTPEMRQDTTGDEQESPQQTASLPPDEAASPDQDPLSILFGVEETELPANSSSTLNRLVDQLKGDASLRVQLMAYASSADGSASSVRRKSLSRALSVREYLMDQGIQSTRIEVRALGDKNEGGEPNRVDAVIEQR